MPNAIAADAQDNLYVSDHMNFRFQKVDRSDKSLISVGGAGDTYGKFARPRGIAVGPDGVIYVVESVYNVVQMFNQQGNVLMAFGNFTGAPGFLLLPASIAVDKSCISILPRTWTRGSRRSISCRDEPGRRGARLAFTPSAT